MDQEARQEKAEIRERLIEAAAHIEDATLRIERRGDYPIQREAQMPTIEREPMLFIVGARNDAGNWEAHDVVAGSTTDAWLDEDEPCADCGEKLPATMEDYEGTIKCMTCGALYTRNCGHWEKQAHANLCENCGIAVESPDGGPAACFRCRIEAGIRTVCSGCGHLHYASPVEPAERKNQIDNIELRLCTKCTTPAPTGTAKTDRSTEDIRAFNAVCDLFATPAQARRAISVAQRIGSPEVPPGRQYDWTNTEMRQATAWLKKALRGTGEGTERTH